MERIMFWRLENASIISKTFPKYRPQRFKVKRFHNPLMWLWLFVFLRKWNGFQNIWKLMYIQGLSVHAAMFYWSHAETEEWGTQPQSVCNTERKCIYSSGFSHSTWTNLRKCFFLNAIPLTKRCSMHAWPWGVFFVCIVGKFLSLLHNSPPLGGLWTFFDVKNMSHVQSPTVSICLCLWPLSQPNVVSLFLSLLVSSLLPRWCMG